MDNMSFTPEQHQALLQLIRTELLEIFKSANSRYGPLSSSTTDLYTGKARPTEYLIQAVEARLKSES